jgi:hypothetical protein
MGPIGASHGGVENVRLTARGGEAHDRVYFVMTTRTPACGSVLSSVAVRLSLRVLLLLGILPGGFAA